MNKKNAYEIAEHYKKEYNFDEPKKLLDELLHQTETVKVTQSFLPKDLAEIIEQYDSAEE